MQGLFSEYDGWNLKLNIIIGETQKIHKWKSAPEKTVRKKLKIIKQISYDQWKQLQ